MANDLTQNPWLIDTAGATALHANVAFVTNFVWSGYSNGATDQCIVQDSRGRTVIAMQGLASLAPVTIAFSLRLPIRGLKVTTLSTGVLAISQAVA